MILFQGVSLAVSVRPVSGKTDARSTSSSIDPLMGIAGPISGPNLPKPADSGSVTEKATTGATFPGGIRPEVKTGNFQHHGAQVHPESGATSPFDDPTLHTDVSSVSLRNSPAGIRPGTNRESGLFCRLVVNK